MFKPQLPRERWQNAGDALQSTVGAPFSFCSSASHCREQAGTMRAAWALLSAACLLVGLGGTAGARTLTQEAPNPFVAAPGGAAGAPTPAAAPAPPAAAPATPPAAAAPAAEAAAKAPSAETQSAAANGAGDACAYTTTGLSGGTNVTRIGCGQWDVVSGSNRFTCFVNDPARCAEGVQLTPSKDFPNAASRECTLEQAQGNPGLPTVSRLIVATPQA